MPIKYRKNEVFRLSENSKKRLKIYDEIIFNALKKRDEDNQSVTVKLRVVLLPTGIIMYEPKEWFIENEPKKWFIEDEENEDS
jgi:hypothetical protein